MFLSLSLSLSLLGRFYRVKLQFCFVFYPAVAIRSCRDKNGGCEHECKDVDQTFRCSCRHGFGLAADNKHCDGQYTPTLNNGHLALGVITPSQIPLTTIVTYLQKCYRSRISNHWATIPACSVVPPIYKQSKKTYCHISF